MRPLVKEHLLTATPLVMVASGIPPGAWTVDRPLFPATFPELSVQAIFSWRDLTVSGNSCSLPCVWVAASMAGRETLQRRKRESGCCSVVERLEVCPCLPGQATRARCVACNGWREPSYHQRPDALLKPASGLAGLPPQAWSPRAGVFFGRAGVPRAGAFFGRAGAACKRTCRSSLSKEISPCISHR